MKHVLLGVVSSMAFAGASPVWAQDAAEVDAVVAAVKAANPDRQVLCQSGREGIAKAATAAVTKLAQEGKIKGNPQAVGGAAGGKIGQECRG